MDKDIKINQDLLSSPGECSSLGVATARPKFQIYARRSKREESFRNWPTHLPTPREDLVEAGLVYTGVGDSVRCYYCGGGLRNWEAGDKPMLEHARWYPDCPHVLLVKGKEYVEAAGRGEDLDLVQASQSGSSTEMAKPVTRPNIRCVAAQSCIDMGYDQEDIEHAMDVFISKEGHSDFKARDLLQIILDQSDPEPEVIGACYVADDERQSSTEDEETEENEVDIDKLYEENQRIKERQLCKICLEDKANIIFLPCGHLVACPQCAPALLKCPLCRLEVKGQVRAQFA